MDHVDRGEPIEQRRETTVSPVIAVVDCAAEAPCRF
jgi:hypothetical protein